MRGLDWKRRWRTIAVFLALLAVGGLLLATSGIIPIQASSGHWPITHWFLSFSMERSVVTHSISIKAPKLDKASLVLRGAGHYETGCRFCHGSPGLHRPPVVQQMTPHPPYLPPAIPEWESKELFYIIKHGVKFTGMPAWPAQQRDDEVWAMVAFLRVLPRLNAEEYEKLIWGETSIHLESEEVPPMVTESCGRCHGVNGRGRGGVAAFPRLAGQRVPYLYASLRAYARGERHSGMMEPIAAGLNPEEMKTLARYYGGLAPYAPTSPRQALARAIERGETIAKQGIPGRRIPSCVDCHGPSTIPHNPYYPVLAGQYAEYIVLQLELFAKEHRGGSPYAGLMHPTAHRLTKGQMRDVAQYYASLPSSASAPAPASPPPSNALEQ
jgi:cytochrome c553